VRETTRLAEVCRTTPVAGGAPPVRLPGSAALARRARQFEEGVTPHPTILARLAPWADRFRVPMPAAV
jgi:LDH2 family malate/lactate/ureidoglycolate dehydrogenase